MVRVWPIRGAEQAPQTFIGFQMKNLNNKWNALFGGTILRSTGSITKRGKSKVFMISQVRHVQIVNCKFNSPRVWGIWGQPVVPCWGAKPSGPIKLFMTCCFC